LSLSILLHELGRAYIASRYKSYIDEIILIPTGGISVRRSLPENDRDELLIAGMSLFFKLFIVLAMIPFIYYLYGFENILRTHIYDFSPMLNFFEINLALLIFNIVPLYPLDSGRMLRSYLISKFDHDRAVKLVVKLTYVIGAVLIIIGFLFGMVLAVFVIFIYAAAQSKSKFDKLAEILSLGDKDAKLREQEEYKLAKKTILERSKQVRIKAEKVLDESHLSLVTGIWLKFRNYFDTELTKGKLTMVRNMLISVLPLVLRIRNVIRLWLNTKQISKSIFLLLISTICLTVFWLMPFEYMLLFSAGFLIAFSLAVFIIYYHTRSKKLTYYTIFGCGAWLVYIALDLFEPRMQLEYWDYLFIEAVKGTMVPVTGIMFFSAMINSNEFFKAAKTTIPIPAFVIVTVLYLIGAIVLFYEIYLISPYETDLNTIRFTLRYDVAFLIWFLASIIILFALVYVMYTGSVIYYGRMTTLKLVASTVLIILLFSFFSRDLIIISYGRSTVQPDELDLKIGLNARNITMLDESEFDNQFHLDVAWSKVYKENGTAPNWSDYDWQIKYASENNIDIYLMVNPQPPRWFINDHPDAVMRDQWNNTFYWIDEDPQKVSRKRPWDLSFNDENVTNAKINFTVQAVKRYHNCSCVKYIAIQNEPTYPVDFNHLRLASYDPVTESAFRVWLQDFFNNDTQEFTNVTKVSIEDWSEINAPRNTTDKLWNKWREFREDSLIKFVLKLMDAVRNNTDKPVTVKIMAHFLVRYQILQTGLSSRVLKMFFKLSDVISLDIYPLTPADLENALMYYKELAGKKPILIPEFNLALGSNLPGSGSLIYYNFLIINKYADIVYIYTGNNHYLYGINLYDHSPVHLGLKLYRLHRSDGNIYSIYDELLMENFKSIPNYYEVYVLGCTAWDLPVLPWPILLIALMPVPIANDKKRWRVKKIMYSIIIIILILSFIGINIT
jgi:Zn-dependent protease